MEMSLRDQFAVAALQNLMSIGGSLFENGMVLAENLSENAYKIADAMMKARGLPAPEMSAAPIPRPTSVQVVCPNAPRILRRGSSKPKASREQIGQIIALHKDGLTNKQIADKLAINGQSVNGVLAVSRNNGGMIKRKDK